MSRMLTLIHAGWLSARSLARSGRRSDALAQVRRLLTRPDLPVTLAADAHRLAAELLIEAEEFAKARRHLRAALGLQPEHARSHYLAGLAFERDPAGDDRRAAIRFRKASEAEPANPVYRASFGRAAVRCDRVRIGVRHLVAAADAAPDNIAVLRVVADGLIEAGKLRMARRVLAKARFLCPRNTEVGRMWERVRFETARAGQRNTKGTQEARFATEGAVLTLPFVRVVNSTAGGRATGWVRGDAISLPRPHLARLRSTNADR